MRNPRWLRSLLALLAVGPSLCLAQGELGLNLYGFSYHFDRERAEELGIDNEVNPGLGLRYRVAGTQVDWFLDGGAYRDGGRNTAIYAGIGGFWKPTERLRLGGALAFFDSNTYNDGEPFIAPLPVVAYEWRAVTLNVFYAPKVSDINEVATLGFWVTLWPKAF
jgi:hypothetical protein